MQPAHRPHPTRRVFSSRVRPISQVTFQVRAHDVEQGFANIRLRALEWIARRAGSPLPPDAWRGEDFELQDVGAQRTAAVTLTNPHYWCARADDADKEVPKRTWTTEFGLAVSGGMLQFGCRLQCASQGDDPPYISTIPWVIRKITQEFDARVDGIRIHERAWYVDGAQDTGRLIGLLLDRARQRPVIIVSQASDPLEEWQSNASEAADALAFRVVGAAHVVVVSENAGFALTHELGKEFSVFNGAVRTYQPAFDPNRDEPTRHPLAMTKSIASWDGGPDGFEDFLAAKVLRSSVSGQDIEKDLPSFAQVRRIALERRSVAARQAGKSEGQLLSLALEEVESLRRQQDDDKRTSDGLLALAEQERDVAIEGRDEAREEAHKLRQRIERLTAALAAKGRTEEIDLPDSLEALGDWAERHLSGFVFIANRALRAAKKSEFEDVALVYRALLIIRDHYVPMRRGNGSAKESYDAALRSEGLEDSGTFYGARAGQHGDEYFVDYGGRRHELDRHIKGSNSRDGRFGLRIYFFWDDSTQQAIIGWLPSHLTTSVS